MSAVFQLLVVSILSPVVLALVMAWIRRGEKKQDWARQDALAGRVDGLVRTAKVTHDLVNRDMTERWEDQLAQTRLTLTMAKRIVDPSEMDKVAIEAAVARIEYLEKLVAERHKQQGIIDNQMGKDFQA